MTVAIILCIHAAAKLRLVVPTKSPALESLAQGFLLLRNAQPCCAAALAAGRPARAAPLARSCREQRPYGRLGREAALRPLRPWGGLAATGKKAPAKGMAEALVSKFLEY